MRVVKKYIGTIEISGGVYIADPKTYFKHPEIPFEKVTVRNVKDGEYHAFALYSIERGSWGKIVSLILCNSDFNFGLARQAIVDYVKVSSGRCGVFSDNFIGQDEERAFADNLSEFTQDSVTFEKGVFSTPMYLEGTYPVSVRTTVSGVVICIEVDFNYSFDRDSDEIDLGDFEIEGELDSETEFTDAYGQAQRTLEDLKKDILDITWEFHNWGLENLGESEMPGYMKIVNSLAGVVDDINEGKYNI